MIEGRTRPAGRRVALIARGRESRLNVTRIRRAVEIGLMALHARSRLGQVVCPARTKRGVVALCALQGRVRSGQGESRGSVIEGGACPIGCAVTGLARSRETSLHVTRIVRAVEIGLMALNARSRRGQVICPARTERGVVALRALQRYVRSVQGEAGACMVEGCIQPVGRVVALLARSRESRLHVVGVRRPVEVRLMAGDARSGVGQVVCPARTERGVVALRALQRDVRTR